MEVARSIVSQRKYVLDLSKGFEMLGCNPTDTPTEPNLKLRNNKYNALINKGKYYRLVVKLTITH